MRSILRFYNFRACARYLQRASGSGQVTADDVQKNIVAGFGLIPYFDNLSLSRACLS